MILCSSICLEILAVFTMKFNVALVVNLITSHDLLHWSTTKKTNVYFVAKQWCNCMTSWNPGWQWPRHSKLKMISLRNFLIWFYRVYFQFLREIFVKFLFTVIKTPLIFRFIVPNVLLSKFLSFILSLNDHELPILTGHWTLTLENPFQDIAILLSKHRIS